MSLISEPTVDFHLKLNEQSFHIPNELLKKNVRLVNKLIERETKKLQLLFKELDVLLIANEDKSGIIKLNEIIRTVEVFEKKLHKRVNIECELLQRIQYRINYYQSLDRLKQGGDRDGLIAWYQKYTNLLIGDYLTRNGACYDKELKEEDQQASTWSSMSSSGTDVTMNDDHSIKSKLKSGSISSAEVSKQGLYGLKVEQKFNAGVEFLKQQKLENLLDYDILLAANKISKSLTLDHNLSPLIEWIKENKSYLNNKSSTLEFETRFQEYIEFLKLEDYTNAISCFQQYLVHFIYSNFEDLKLASGLLVFIKSCKERKPDYATSREKKTPGNLFPTLKNTDDCYNYFFHKRAPTNSSKSRPMSLDDFKVKHFSNNMDFACYMELLDDKRWEKLNELFLREYYSMYGISYHDPLLIYLSLGISTLKTKDCLHVSPPMVSENVELEQYLEKEVVRNTCPICSEEFSPIAKDLPYAHHIQSKLFENPVMLPNGNIYDSKKLRALASRLNKKMLYSLEDHQVMDPIDRKVYSETDFITMYPT